MAKAFDTDPLGSLLEYTGLMGGNPVQPTPQQAAWERSNLRVPDHQTWVGPAMFAQGLLARLAPRRDRGVVKRTLHRVVRVAESNGLIEPLSTDDNPETRYRVLTPLGRELLEEDSYLEFVSGATFIVQKWRSSVVKIVHPSDAGIGTGFLIAPDLVATARHVLDGLGEFVVEFEDGSRAGHADVILPTLEDLDIAVIRLQAPAPAPARPFRLARDADLLDEVVVFGFPPVPFTRDAFLVVNKGEISSEVTLHTGIQAIVVSCLLRGGNSGGPVVDRRGHVAGVVSQNLFRQIAADEHSLNEGIGFAAAVPAVWLADLLAGKA